jgi:diguanylate cyclase (GGDEF)-like protein
MAAFFISTLVFEFLGKKKWTYSCLIILGICWFFTQNLESRSLLLKISFLGLSWILFFALIRLLKRTDLATLKDLDSQIDQKKYSLNSLTESEKTVQEEFKVLEYSLQQKEGLYQSLKELNKTLEFPKTVEVFSKIASQLTNFEEGWLFLASSQPASDIQPMCYYLVRNRPPIPKKGLAEDLLIHYQKEVYAVALKSKSLLFFNPQEDLRFIQSGISSKTSSIVGMSLFHEQSLLGVLILEGCKKRDLESLEILAIQLSMEIEKDRLYEKVKNLSIIDGLTQIYQKRHLMMLLKEELLRLEKQKKTCSVLMADIDHFKDFNDTFGHLVGDILLKELSFSIQGNLRPTDLVGRFGGEEFLIALPETTQEEAMQIAQRIRNDIQSKNFTIHDKLFKLTLSIGISSFPDQSKDLYQLIEMADEALYEAKRSGRNQVILYKKNP